MKRRDFVKASSTLFVAPSIIKNVIENKPNIRLAFIGTGMRGILHLKNALERSDIEVTAICDIQEASIQNALHLIKAKGHKVPAIYKASERDFENMVLRDDIDGVIISTPWEWHVPMSLASMKAGKYTGVEVSATVTLQDSWALVSMYEKTGSHLMILENVCYRKDVMAVLNMVRKGVFGEMLYAHCGYQHDLRDVKFNDGKSFEGKGVEFGKNAFSEAKWRTQHSLDRNGDLYPTHGLGPVAHWLDINRGNQFTYLTSMATKSRGLHKYIVDTAGKEHPNAKFNFKLGDIVTTNIQCANGENIVLVHDTNNARAYSLGFRAQGTEGIWMDDNKSIYLDKISPKPHNWEPFESYQTQYQHPLWKKYEQNAKGSGHGGMDFFVLNAFVESIKNKTSPPIDVYDAAAWSAISPLSEKSIEKGSKPIAIPDFTRGKWKTNKRIFGLDDKA
ncbi:MAG: Gfo/Idh/MocA family protein [Leadbetterella sp.]